ncbi:MAG: DUF4012 domain-containing protein, partial [Propionicimonas sp.]|nr:DUF4012 domain-containing protein [Propionicimonas sp.]
MPPDDTAPPGPDAPASSEPPAAPPATGADAPAAPAARGRRWPRIVLWGVAGVLLAGVALGAWLAVDALRARDALEEAADAVRLVVDDLQDDPAAAQAAVAGLQDAAGRAADATSGPHWTIAGWLPWIGDDTRALQTITRSVDTLATSALPPLVTVAGSVTPEQLAPRDGRLDVSALAAVAGPVGTADQTIGALQAEVAGIDRSGLVGPLAEATDRFAGELAKARGVTSAAAAATALLPPLLGADGPRDWIVLAQNNAETRATGGIPGALTHLRAADGRLTILGQRTAGDFGPYPEPVLPLTDDELRLFGTKLGRYLQDVNFTPDFPRTAELVRAMWQEADGTAIQNVVSLDPVALQTLLAATGPVAFRDPLGATVTLGGDNAASFLLSGVYAAYDRQEVQDAVFALAAQAVFARLMSGDVDPAALLRAVSEVASQGRLMVWSADPGEQQQLESAGIAGALRGAVPAGTSTAPEIGVFANLTTASKTGYYLDLAAGVTTVAEAADGSRELEVRV